MKKFQLYLTILTISLVFSGLMSAAPPFIVFQQGQNTMTVKEPGTALNIFTDTKDGGVQMAVHSFQMDLEKVTGEKPLILDTGKSGQPLIIVGTFGTNSIVDRLIREKQFDGSLLKNKREKFIIQNIKNPFDKNSEAILIAGSDKRGTIYGIYEFSEQIGVSPWYYWADVPIEKKAALYFKKGTYTDGEPAVEYRGIFLNDEWPSLGGWATATFGGFNSQFYQKVFELVLRLKGNFLWPAMWDSAFYDDDPQNGPLANEMGIVMGTSHHEPMAMAQQDWRRYIKKNNLPNVWNYNKNEKVLNTFWTLGIERSKNWEKLVTIGMRGDGDEAMEAGTNVALLQKIIKDQREIIRKVTGKSADKTPQVWALYKEVQDYYDAGMRVPDDITILISDDNWGNVRKLPDLTKPQHKGGYGMYYHFDYVGEPRNSKWINISPIQRVWEQMNLTYVHGVKKLWVVNVGDLKPMEFPISFFMEMAWNPSQFNADNLMEYTQQWATQQFGPEHSAEIAKMLTLYAKYNRRVTPETLDDQTYSLENYNEFTTVLDEYRALALDANRLYNEIPEAYKSTYFQLVLYPIDAASNLYEMYYAVAKNKKLAAENNPEANHYADLVKQKFGYDELLKDRYEKGISNGKWIHMMDQTHIGYTYWQQPPTNVMPKVQYVEIKPVAKIFEEADGYVSIEAENFSRANSSNGFSWKVIPYFGKTKSGLTTLPQDRIPTAEDNVSVEYDIDFKSTGTFPVQLFLAPTLNYNSNKGLRYEISLDGKDPQVINFNGKYRGELGQWQSEAIIKSDSKIVVDQPGKHTLKIKVLNPGIVFEKIVVDTGGLRPTYLGAPESDYRIEN